jgi:serine/threonine protein kinase
VIHPTACFPRGFIHPQLGNINGSADTVQKWYDCHVRCLTDNDATEFLAGALSAKDLTRIESHLAACKDCRTLIAAVAPAMDDGRNDSDVATAPRQVRGRSTSELGKGPLPPVLPHELAVAPTEPLGAQLPRKNIGDRVGRYLVLGTLGVGGMGVVFTAYDPQLDRKIALKLLRAALGTGPLAKEASTRLRREAQAIARLSHPHVVAVYDVGTTDDGDVYLAMEFVDGQNLTAWLRAWARPWHDILDIFVQAGKGLAAAHDVGLLHRDFKPDNVLVGEHGRVRVGDFGLARSVLSPDEAQTIVSTVSPLNASLTATGTVLGTPRYMPPEQLTGQPIDGRSDQFSFCVALYEALFGQHPLPGNTAVSMLEQRARAAVPPDGRVPVSIVRAIMRGLEPDPNKRFASMHVLLNEITPAVPRRRWALVAAGLAAVVVIGGVALATVARNQRLNADGTEEQLTKRIAALEADRSMLLSEVQKLSKNKEATAEEISRLHSEVAKKDREISLLITEIGVRVESRTGSNVRDRAGSAGGAAVTIQATAARPTFERPPEKLPGFAVGSPVQGPTRPQNASSINAAVTNANPVLRGCFHEWSERYPGREISMTIKTAVSPEGIAHSAIANGSDDSSLPVCVTDAVKRISFPIAIDPVDVVITANWSGDALTTRTLLTRRMPSAGIIDID